MHRKGGGIPASWLPCGWSEALVSFFSSLAISATSLENKAGPLGLMVQTQENSPLCLSALRTRWGPQGEQRPQSWECTNTPTLCAAGSWHSGKAHTNSLRRHILLRALNEKCIHGDHSPLLWEERKTELLPLRSRFPSPWTVGPCEGQRCILKLHPRIMTP